MQNNSSIKAAYPRLFLLFATLASFALYIYEAPANCQQFDMTTCNQLHTAIVNGTAASPYSYRILAPALVNVFAPNASEGALTVAYALLTFICLALAYPALYLWLRRWASEDRALLGIMLTAVLCGLAFHVWFFSPYNIVEFALICVALASVQSRFAVYVVLTMLAAFNRETGILTVALFAAFYGLEGANRRKLAQTALLALVWLGITVLLRLVIPTTGAYITFEHQLDVNLHAIPQSVFNNLPQIHLLVLTIGGFRSTPPVLRRMVWVAGGYLLVLVASAGWQEFPRYMLSAIPLALPVILTKRN